MEKRQVIARLSALAHEARLDVFRFLVQQGPSGVPAGEIGERFALPAATLSFHLSALRHAGLVDNRRSGRQVWYFARYEAMSELMAFLMDNCCQGHADACAFLTDFTPKALCEQCGSTEPFLNGDRS